jgi:hypothetical protein
VSLVEHIHTHTYTHTHTHLVDLLYVFQVDVVSLVEAHFGPLEELSPPVAHVHLAHYHCVCVCV